ncbi:MAG: hypothetical protein KatS3mg080_1027 [Anoxybacillus sp.]|nr:MAG: hypothetical protein KatS3mg080_1027 [Anoxybacillus sp.]
MKSEPTLLSQLGAVRGLTAAFLATKEEKYRRSCASHLCSRWINISGISRCMFTERPKVR